jgi:hypothetical protein
MDRLQHAVSGNRLGFLSWLPVSANVVIARSARVVSGAVHGAALRRAHELDGVAARQEPAH